MSLSLVVVAQVYPPDAIWRETRFPTVLPLPLRQSINLSLSASRAREYAWQSRRKKKDRISIGLRDRWVATNRDPDRVVGVGAMVVGEVASGGTRCRDIDLCGDRAAVLSYCNCGPRTCQEK